jgi:hypothetical protein
MTRLLLAGLAALLLASRIYSLAIVKKGGGTRAVVSRRKKLKNIKEGFDERNENTY